jgi:hypothetical protein
MTDFQKYREAVRKKVCQHCIDFAKEKDECALTEDERCGVEMFLEKIVEVVHFVHSDKLDDYVVVLRQKVCADCKSQSPDGICTLRTKAACGLDRYFELVVEAIEEVDAL